MSIILGLNGRYRRPAAPPASLTQPFGLVDFGEDNGTTPDRHYTVTHTGELNLGASGGAIGAFVRLSQNAGTGQQTILGAGGSGGGGAAAQPVFQETYIKEYDNKTVTDPQDAAAVRVGSGTNRVVLDLISHSPGIAAEGNLVSNVLGPGGVAAGLTRLTRGTAPAGATTGEVWALLQAGMPVAGSYTLRADFAGALAVHREVVVFENARQVVSANSAGVDNSTTVSVTVNRSGGGNFPVGSKVYAIATDGDGARTYDMTGDVFQVRQDSADWTGGNGHCFAKGTLRTAKASVVVTVTLSSSSARLACAVAVVEPADGVSPVNLQPVEIVGDRFYSGGQPYFPTTHFLWGSTNNQFSHIFFSPNIDDRHRHGLFTTLKNEGYNTIYIYTMNENDYGGLSVTPYAAGFAGSFSDVKLAIWRQRFIQMLDDGLRPVIWTRADDSPTVNGITEANYKAYLDRMVTEFDDLPIMWVLGLEGDEYWTTAIHTNRGSYLASIAANPVGAHTTSDVIAGYLNAAWVQFACLQRLQAQTPLQHYDFIVANKATIGTRPLIFAEHVQGNVNGLTVESQEDALAGAFAGCAGFGNGGPPGLGAFMASLPDGMAPSRVGDVLTLAGGGVTATADISALSFSAVGLETQASLEIGITEASHGSVPNEFNATVSDGTTSVALVSTGDAVVLAQLMLVVLQINAGVLQLYTCLPGAAAVLRDSDTAPAGDIVVGTWFMGRRADATGHYQEELCVNFKSDRALSASEIAQIANNASPDALLGADLAGWWPFLDGAITTEPDDSTNDNPAVRGGTWTPGGGGGGDTDPAVHLQLTETGGLTAFDARGVRNGQFVGPVDLGLPSMATSGVVGGVGVKDGAHILIPHDAVFAVTGAYTITFLFSRSVAIPADGGRTGVYSKPNSGGPNGISIEIIRTSGQGFLRAFTVNDAGVARWMNNSTTGVGPALVVGTTYRCTLIGSPTGARLLLDTAEIGSNDVLDGLDGNAQNAALGGYLNPGTGLLEIPHNGCFADFRFYPRALSQAEIEALPAPQDTIWLRDIANVDILEGTGRLVDLAPFSHPETGILAEAGEDDPDDLVFHDTPSGTNLVLNTTALPDEPPPSGAARILLLTMNQASGDMTDAALGNPGVVTGTLERSVPGILTGSSASAASPGTAYLTLAHIPRYAERPDDTPVVDFSFVQWRQRDTNPAVSSSFVAASKDAVGMAGGWSMEEYNDAGTVKLRAYIRNASGTPVWIGSQLGVGAALATGVAHRYALTYTAGTAALWIDDGAAEATQAITGPGLSGNTAALAVFAYNGGTAGFDGIIDDTLMYDYALTQAEIEALDDAVSVTHGAPPPDPATFTCLLRSSGTLVNTHKNLGTISGAADFRFLNQGGNARYDMTGTIRETNLVNPPGDLTWNGKRSLFRSETNHSGACVSGGAFHCPNMTPDYNWNAIYQSGNTPVAAIQLREATITDFLIEGVRIHGGFDGFQTGSGTRDTCSNIRIRKCAMTEMRDDAVEWDNWIPDGVVEDNLIESFVFISNRNTGFNGSSRVMTVQNNLVYLLPCRIRRQC